MLEELKSSSEDSKSQIVNFWKLLVSRNCPNFDVTCVELHFPYLRKLVGCKVSAKNEKLYKNVVNVPTCETLVCVETGSFVHSFIDASVPPCKSPMLHACGGFNKIPLNDRYELRSWNLIFYEKVDEQYRRSLSQKISKDEIFPIQLVKKYFVECTGRDCEFPQFSLVLRMSLNNFISNFISSTFDTFG